MMKLVTLLISLFSVAYASCASRDYESLIGGYQYVHSALSIVFDVDPNTNDLVVAGQAEQFKTKVGYIYFVQE